MADFTVGPKYPTVIHATTGAVYMPTRVYANDGSEAILDDTPHSGATINAGGFGFSLPLDATIIGVLVEVEAYSGAGTYPYMYAQIGSGGYYGAGAKVASITPTLTNVTFGGLADTWVGQGGPFTPAYLNAINIIIGQNGYNDVNMAVDYIRVTIKYSTPPQAINLSPAVMRLGSLAQSVTRANQGDITTYQNEVRPGEVVAAAKVKLLTYGAEPANPTKGAIWLDTSIPGTPIRVWNGTKWQLLVQPDSFVLGGFASQRASKAPDWETVRAFQVQMKNIWGWSWLLTGLNDANIARIRFNGSESLVYTFGANDVGFSFYESRNVYGAARKSGSVSDTYEVTSLEDSLPEDITLIELQMKRVSASVDGVITSFTMWLHPR